MNHQLLKLILVTSMLGIPFYANAHNPKEHMKNAEAPKCEAMQKMDHSKMDMDDPIMQAMMKQCMSRMEHGSKNSSPHIHNSNLQKNKSTEEHHSAHHQ